MILADKIAKHLEERGITHVFVYAGGTVSFLLDAIERNTNIKIIVCRHEQACAFAASAFSKSGNGLGCCISTSGPGALNLVTGIADAFYDYTPMLAIVGQCGSSALDKYINISCRQNGFQYTNVVDITKSITVTNIEIENDIDIIEVVDDIISDAYLFNGPVLISIPIDIQRKEII